MIPAYSTELTFCTTSLKTCWIPMRVLALLSTNSMPFERAQSSASFRLTTRSYMKRDSIHISSCVERPSPPRFSRYLSCLPPRYLVDLVADQELDDVTASGRAVYLDFLQPEVQILERIASSHVVHCDQRISTMRESSNSWKQRENPSDVPSTMPWAPR
jgi:hypothetical protein